MTPRPNIGDIWKWHSNIFTMPTSYVLIVTAPNRSHDGWDFQALELDGSESGVVQGWSMYDSQSEHWEFIA